MSRKRLISMDEVIKHNTVGDCWIVFHDKVYDLTSFLPEHPGGIPIIASHAGKVATAIFEQIHPKSMLRILPKSSYIGTIDKSSIKPKRGDVSLVGRDKNIHIPPIEQLLNTFDFKAAASKCMQVQGWNYYISGAEDEITFRENQAVFSRIWFRPRVLVDVSSINIVTHILGYKSSSPFYVTATALGKLAHPDGEVAITRACHNEGIIQMIPTLASCSMDEMCQAAQPGQIQFLQLYVNSDRSIAKQSIEKALNYGIKVLCITVDAPQLGRRERDMRHKALALKDAPKLEKDNYSDKYKKNNNNNNKKSGTQFPSGGVAASISSFIDPSLNWNDILWIRKQCTNGKNGNSMKLCLKGIQCGEDAIKAVEYGIDAIILSNHGGRQLDYGRSGIEILVEVMDYLDANSMRDRIEVWVDGGFRRGTDIFKALALGAKCVGIGRPFLYGLACYGQNGVERISQIFKNELETCMQMMGTPTLRDIKKNMLVYKNVTDHITAAPQNINALNTYTPIKTAVKYNSKL
eukprot:744326_1